MSKWEYSNVQCFICTHKWVAVRPQGLQKLQCPNCGLLAGFEIVATSPEQTPPTLNTSGPEIGEDINYFGDRQDCPGK